MGLLKEQLPPREHTRGALLANSVDTFAAVSEAFGHGH